MKNQKCRNQRELCEYNNYAQTLVWREIWKHRAGWWSENDRLVGCRVCRARAAGQAEHSSIHRKHHYVESGSAVAWEMSKKWKQQDPSEEKCSTQKSKWTNVWQVKDDASERKGTRRKRGGREVRKNEKEKKRRSRWRESNCGRDLGRNRQVQRRRAPSLQIWK